MAKSSNDKTNSESCLISYTKYPWADGREFAVDKIISLDEDVFTIGWAPNADCSLDSPILSRIHSVFTKWNGVWHVKDNNSENGVYVNGVKLVAREQTPLQDGCSVCFGEKTPDEELFFTFTENKGFSGGDKLKKENERLEKEVEHFRNELLQRERKAEENLHEKQIEFELMARKKRKYKSQSELLTKLSSVLESELECWICSEMIIKAVVLNCSHSFCSYCVSEWKRKKPKCPLCRTKITSETPSQVLNSIIDNVVETWSSELKSQREQLLQTRLVHQNRAVEDED